MAIALDTPAAARISSDANSDRYCWEDRREMVEGIRYAVMAIRMMDNRNRRINDIFLVNRIEDCQTSGMGKTMSTTSVSMSQTPMTISWTSPSRHFGPGSGTTCQ